VGSQAAGTDPYPRRTDKLRRRQDRSRDHVRNGTSHEGTHELEQQRLTVAGQGDNAAESLHRSKELQCLCKPLSCKRRSGEITVNLTHVLRSHGFTGHSISI
jgi:hypothetical protein